MDTLVPVDVILLPEMLTTFIQLVAVTTAMYENVS